MAKFAKAEIRLKWTEILCRFWISKICFWQTLPKMAIQETSGQGSDFYLVKVKKNATFQTFFFKVRSLNVKILALRGWFRQNAFRLALVRVQSTQKCQKPILGFWRVLVTVPCMAFVKPILVLFYLLFCSAICYAFCKISRR